MMLNTRATLLHHHCRSGRSAKPNQRQPGLRDTSDAAAISDRSLRTNDQTHIPPADEGLGFRP